MSTAPVKNQKQNPAYPGFVDRGTEEQKTTEHTTSWTAWFPDSNLPRKPRSARHNAKSTTTKGGKYPAPGGIYGVDYDLTGQNRTLETMCQAETVQRNQVLSDYLEKERTYEFRI